MDNMGGHRMLKRIMTILPQSMQAIFAKLPHRVIEQLEEIRVRENRPLEIVYGGTYGFVACDGTVLHAVHASPRLPALYMPTREQCLQLLDLLANHSLYTLEEQLRRGYVTVRGGHRIGLAGTTSVEQGAVKQLKTISSFNIRLAREVHNAGTHLLPQLLDHPAKTVHHTLIISAPQHGKTTVIRDIARLLSYGYWPMPYAHWSGLKVGIVDERSEIAACHEGVPTFDVGPRTDVLDSCPKAEGMMMMIRSMSPDVIIVDEIGRSEDAIAIHEAIHAGIRVMATAHGHRLDDMKRRPILHDLMKEKVFSRYAILVRSHGNTQLKQVYDENGVPLLASRGSEGRFEHG